MSRGDLRNLQAASNRCRNTSAAFLNSDRNRRHAKGPETIFMPIWNGFGGPYPRPKYCQWIPGEPSADDKCKCRAPVMEASPDERPSPYCAEHEAWAHGRQVAA